MTRALLGSLLFSLLGLGLVLWWGNIGLSDLRRALDVSLTGLLAALLSLGLSFALAAWRLQILCRVLGLRLKRRHALRTHILGIFSAAVTPGGSGAAPAIALTLQYQGLSSAQGWAAAIRLFVADALFLAWALPLSLVHLRLTGLYPASLGWTLLGILATAGCAFIALLLTYRLRWLAPLAGLVCRGPLLPFRRRALRFSESVTTSSVNFRHAGARLVAQLQLSTALSWTAFFGVLALIAWGFGLQIGLLETISWQVAVTALSFAVPTPGGSGVLELGTSALLLNRGADSVVPAVLVVYRLLTYYLFFALGPLLGGYVVVRASEK